MRENEDAAQALGVDATAVKLGAMVISGAITAAAGCFYAQYFLFVDSGIAYGTWISIEALLTPIIGGVGTVFGPLLGALVVQGARRSRAAGEPAMRPGSISSSMACVLVLVICVPAARLIGALAHRPQSLTAPGRAGGRPWLSLCSRSSASPRRFGGLLAVNAASLAAPAGRITALIGPNGAGKTTLFAIISGFLKPSDGTRPSMRGEDVTGEPPHRLARRGIARTFQIVQPFAGLTVRENIAGRRPSAPSRRAGGAGRRRAGRPRGRSRRSARPPRRHADRRRPQAARTRARARDRAEAAAARRGAGRAQPVRRSATSCR